VIKPFFLFYSGCRTSELCNLTVGDYTIDDGFRVLDFQLQKGSKNRVALNPECSKVLDTYLETSEHSQDTSAPLFFSRKKDKNGNLRKLSREQIFRIWDKYAKFCGLQHTFPHSARQALGCHSLKNGCTIENLQKLFGHINISTTKAYDRREYHHSQSASFTVKY